MVNDVVKQKKSGKFRCIGRICWILLFLCICTGCRSNATDETESLVVLDDNFNTTSEEMTESSEEEVSTELEVIEMISVYVCGAVNNEGVYELAYGSRIYEALEAAGGMTEEAMKTYLNLAEVLVDGQKIYVPTDDEVEEGLVTSYDESEEGSSSGKVNINTASKSELMTLTGIGEAKADSIIAYRESNGTFTAPEDIMLIDGIKEGVYNQIADEIVTQ
ncbi:MAG: helix-hairpin-helix domain-containing protein [Eubacteriales bacterium]